MRKGSKEGGPEGGVSRRENEAREDPLELSDNLLLNTCHVSQPATPRESLVDFGFVPVPPLLVPRSFLCYSGFIHRLFSEKNSSFPEKFHS